MSRFWLILTVSIVLTVVAAIITGVADIWTESGSAVQLRAAPVLRTESLAVIVIAGLCWLAFGLRLYLDARDRARDARDRAREQRLAERLAEEFRRREALIVTTLGRFVSTATGPLLKLVPPPR